LEYNNFHNNSSFHVTHKKRHFVPSLILYYVERWKVLLCLRNIIINYVNINYVNYINYVKKKSDFVAQCYYHDKIINTDINNTGN